MTSMGVTGMKMKADSSAVLCGFLTICCGPGYSAVFHKGKPFRGCQYVRQNGAVLNIVFFGLSDSCDYVNAGTVN